MIFAAQVGRAVLYKEERFPTVRRSSQSGEIPIEPSGRDPIEGGRLPIVCGEISLDTKEGPCVLLQPPIATPAVSGGNGRIQSVGEVESIGEW